MEGSDHFYRTAYAEDANRTLEAENAKLKQELEAVGTAAYLYGRGDLKAENAKLREDNDRLIQAIEDLHNVSLEDELVQLENENAKLRELLTFYLGCLTKGHVNCDSCALSEDVCEHGRKVIDWARKLGVEVDG